MGAQGRPRGKKGTAAIVGAGAVGTTLGAALRERGWRVRFASRRLRSARRAAAATGGEAARDAVEAVRGADLVLLTVPDPFAPAVARDLARRGAFRERALVLLASGYLPSRVLEPARAAGALVATMHPLQTFVASRPDPKRLRGIAFACEGEPPAVGRAKRLARSLGGRPFRIEAVDKPLYHAAASVASNLTVALFRVAADLFQFSTGRRDAVRALGPLLEGTLQNLRRVGVPRALTGPIARGDTAVLRGHLERITKIAPEFLRVYSTLAHEAIRVAILKGSVSDKKVRALSTTLGEFERSK